MWKIKIFSYVYSIIWLSNHVMCTHTHISKEFLKNCNSSAGKDECVMCNILTNLNYQMRAQSVNVCILIYLWKGSSELRKWEVSGLPWGEAPPKVKTEEGDSGIWYRGSTPCAKSPIAERSCCTAVSARYWRHTDIWLFYGGFWAGLF